jgi:hypothetical protein
MVKGFLERLKRFLECIIEALDRREDKVLSAIAQARDTQHAKMVDHEDAWK